jgi:hypothetical protein
MIIAELCRATATGNGSAMTTWNEVQAKQKQCQVAYLKCVVAKRTNDRVFNQMYWNDSEALGQCVIAGAVPTPAQ